MSEVKNIFDISGRAMSAQLLRLNTVASNLANANNVSGSAEDAYRAIKPVFETKYAESFERSGIATVDAVNVKAINRLPEKVFMPEHPKADNEGFIYNAAVNIEEEMVEMLEASRQYQNNVEVISTLRALMMRTIQMGK
ncbi:MAG: flagellar basal body rod protein FlgC [Rhodobacteraceae bacterium]|nr:MAG: flagellar basal body rod protein FlgC [Paracoccaceae bacterium]|tara:strand:+ start:2278 stop:2694 length:417 start_codon:yes stop_codon:yes gene_type:complete